MIMCSTVTLRSNHQLSGYKLSTHKLSEPIQRERLALPPDDSLLLDFNFYRFTKFSAIGTVRAVGKLHS